MHTQFCRPDTQSTSKLDESERSEIAFTLTGAVCSVMQLASVSATLRNGVRNSAPMCLLHNVYIVFCYIKATFAVNIVVRVKTI